MKFTTSDGKIVSGFTTIHDNIRRIIESNVFSDLTIKYANIYFKSNDISDQDCMEKQILKKLSEMSYCHMSGDIYAISENSIFTENFSKCFLSFCIILFNWLNTAKKQTKLSAYHIDSAFKWINNMSKSIKE